MHLSDAEIPQISNLFLQLEYKEILRWPIDFGGEGGEKNISPTNSLLHHIKCCMFRMSACFMDKYY